MRLIMKVDDFGRFHAAPKLLRSLLFPIRDGIRDADIVRWLAECESAGLIRVYTSKDAKPLLQIEKFQQRSRAERSKYDDPPTPDGSPPDCRQMLGSQVTVTRPSSAHGGGDDSRSSETIVAAPPDLVLPFSSDQFREAWLDFVSMRSEIKKPLRATAIKLSLAKLSKMGESNAIRSLQESTANQWQGLFELKTEARTVSDANRDPRGNLAALEEHRRRKSALFGGDHEATSAS